jgi:hypothetical protein
MTDRKFDLQLVDYGTALSTADWWSFAPRGRGWHIDSDNKLLSESGLLGFVTAC